MVSQRFLTLRCPQTRLARALAPRGKSADAFHRTFVMVNGD